ncbi:helix-turn-helix domain-containing protein [Streptomyces sp. NPDC001404]|uniref:helix-turn-helix domain-containing protein n=1 Tax=Streptomyces sp. NPDC001404 TaxID=3364571 RepID=UPI0036CC1327
MQQSTPREHFAAGLLDDEQFRHACANRDMGTVFRLLNHRGFSTRLIAELAGITQGRLYDYMNGKRRVEKLAIFEQIADGFRIPGHLLGLANRPWEPRLSPPEDARPPRPADADDLTAMTTFRDADRATGGGRLYEAVARHLSNTIARRLVDANSEPQVFAAAGAFAEMAGWMAHDSGRDELADKHFARALALARASGDTLLSANIAASSSHLALQTGDPARAVHWAHAGLDIASRGPSSSSLTAKLHAMKARAAAAAAQPATASRALDQACQDLDKQPTTAHSWVSPFDTASLASEAALAMRDIGRYDDALEHAEQAIQLCEKGRARSLALSRITLVTIHVCRADMDAVVQFGRDLLTTDPSLSSVRVTNHVANLRNRLADHRSYPPVRDFLACLDDFMRTRSLLLADLMPPRSEGAPT